MANDPHFVPAFHELLLWHEIFQSAHDITSPEFCRICERQGRAQTTARLMHAPLSRFCHCSSWEIRSFCLWTSPSALLISPRIWKMLLRVSIGISISHL